MRPGRMTGLRSAIASRSLRPLRILLRDPQQECCIRTTYFDRSLPMHEDSESVFIIPGATKLETDIRDSILGDLVYMDGM